MSGDAREPPPRTSGLVSSRLRRATGARQAWTAPNGCVVDLPLILDLVGLDPGTHSRMWRVEATVSLVAGEPCLTRMWIGADSGLDPRHLQEKFRWATPLEVVTVTVPGLLARGVDPFTYEYATRGYPDAAQVSRRRQRQLTDAFLEDVAWRYVAIGRGYAAVIAKERDVAPRTVVSWIEKARSRGILTAATPGVAAGEVVPPERRRAGAEN